ncbi:MAG: helix-turn-helix domain-containing protein [Vicinamibacterales bacterium]
MAESEVPPRYDAQVKRRMTIVSYASEHGIKPASRHFGLARRTIRTWLRRWQADGNRGLVPLYPRERRRRVPLETIELIRIARMQHRWGAQRTSAWLERDHHRFVHARTIQRVFRDIGIPVLAKTAAPPHVAQVFDERPPHDVIEATVDMVAQLNGLMSGPG